MKTPAGNLEAGTATNLGLSPGSPQIVGMERSQSGRARKGKGAYFLFPPLFLGAWNRQQSIINSTHTSATPGFDSRPHCLEASALATSPSLLPHLFSHSSQPQLIFPCCFVLVKLVGTAVSCVCHTTYG